MGADTEKCSPDKLVEHLRSCRQNMVQTAEQYEFLHRILPPLTTHLASDLSAVEPSGCPSPASPAEQIGGYPAQSALAGNGSVCMSQIGSGCMDGASQPASLDGNNTPKQ